jgi:glycosyltransferase involved in cell wall biosynthesis
MINHISVVIITKNAEDTIRSSLQSLKDFEDVVVYDSGSQDNTLEIVKSFENIALYNGDFIGFGETKNHAMSLAKNDWIFSLDADEMMSEELITDIGTLELSPKRVGKVLRKNLFMGKEMIYGGWGSDKIIRLFNRKDYDFSNAKVHEKIEIDSLAEIVFLKGFLNHEAINNLSQTLDKANLYSELYSYENDKSYTISIILIKTHYAFFRSYFLQKGFLAGWRGLVLAFANSIGVFYKYMKIYSRKNFKK